MLEEKLVDLQIQISALTIAIEKLTLAVTPRAEPQSKTQPDPIPVPEPKHEPKPTPLAKSAKKISIEIADDKVDVVSIDVLRDKCMQIVRADPSCKPEVMALIATFGGAEKVQDVPIADRAALLVALEKL